VLSGGQHSPHKIQGIGAGFIPEILDRSVIDEIVKVNSAQPAIEIARALPATRAFRAAFSSGAAIAAALEIGKRPESAARPFWRSCVVLGALSVDGAVRGI